MLNPCAAMTDDLTIRAARPEDARLLWEWRNAPDVRAVSLDSKPIPFEQHREWYERSLANPDRVILIVEYEMTPAAMVRFDHDKGIATVSIILASEIRGKGMAKRILASTIDEVLPRPQALRAFIKPENAPSLALFHGVGFEIVQDGDPLVLEMTMPE